MTAPVFHVAPDSLAAAVPGAMVVLDGDEGRHAVTVRRIRVGEPVDLVDGSGRRASGTVAGIDGRDRLSVAVSDVVDESIPDPPLTVVQALPKGDRAALAVELLTEVGVDSLVPWSAARCVTQWRGDKAAAGAQRWSVTAREAAKQARRARIPAVSPLTDLAAVTDLVRDTMAAGGLAAVLHESATRRLTALPLAAATAVVLVVGPEGGVTDAELAALAAAGAVPVRLGSTVLRTSTAGAAAAAVVMAAVGRW